MSTDKLWCDYRKEKPGPEMQTLKDCALERKNPHKLKTKPVQINLILAIYKHREFKRESFGPNMK